MTELINEAARTLAIRLAGPLKLNAPSQENLVRLLPFYLTDHEYWKDVRKFAYALATPYHETGKVQRIAGKKVLIRFAPIKETRAHPVRQAALYRQQEKYWSTNCYGRGLVQITWPDNYTKFEKITGKPLRANPDLALDLETSYIILREGMHVGYFTGKKLSDYINAQQCDYVNARRIINGLDKAVEIAKIARAIEVVLTS